MNLLIWISEACLIALLSYVCGATPSGYLIGRLNGIDICQVGSHNIGATNVRRVLGRKWSILCFIMDFLKGLLSVLLFGKFLVGALEWQIGSGWGMTIAAICAVLGHIYPFWLKFKGGKGVATSFGVACALAYKELIIGLLVWLILFYSCKRIVSIASMGSTLVMAIMSTIFWWNGRQIGIVTLLLYALAVMVIIRHKENIIRLKNGQENSFVKVPSRNDDTP